MKAKITEQIISELGSMSDVDLAKKYNVAEGTTRKWRKKFDIPTYRSKFAPLETTCALCKKKIVKNQKDFRRSKNLFCSTLCANQYQKTRDEATLKYEKGWKKIRQLVRDRDKVCVVCSKKDKDRELQVHHLTPFKFGGKNEMGNLVGLCRSCHSKIEHKTSKMLELLDIKFIIKDGKLEASLFAPNKIIKETDD